jgi:hypothetical protein
MAQVGDQLAQVSQSLDTLPAATRQTLVSEVGVDTAASLATVQSESFNAFVQAATGAPNEIVSGAQVASADSLNAVLAEMGYEYPGFIPKSNVLLGPSVANQYVRVYKSGTGSFPTGRWMMLKSEIEGLTPAQVKDVYALPVVPDRIVDVSLPAAEPLAVGVAAGAEHGNPFGAGGRMQIYWNRGVIDWTKVASYFTNDRAIGSVVQ